MLLFRKHQNLHTHTNKNKYMLMLACIFERKRKETVISSSQYFLHCIDFFYICMILRERMSFSFSVKVSENVRLCKRKWTNILASTSLDLLTRMLGATNVGILYKWQRRTKWLSNSKARLPEVISRRKRELQYWSFPFARKVIFAFVA